MKIKTDTPLVKKAREGVMEFLLVRVKGAINSGSGSSGNGRHLVRLKHLRAVPPAGAVRLEVEAEPAVVAAAAPTVPVPVPVAAAQTTQADKRMYRAVPTAAMAPV
jgi:hypothetical protein